MPELCHMVPFQGSMLNVVKRLQRDVFRACAPVRECATPVERLRTELARGIESEVIGDRDQGHFGLPGLLEVLGWW